MPDTQHPRTERTGDMRMKLPDPRRMLIDDRPISDEEFRTQNLVYVISAAVLMIAGPLFIYHGFNLLPWPYTAKWGALSIAIGFFVLIFGFSLWQDRQVQILQRMYTRDAAEMKQIPQGTERRGQTIRRTGYAGAVLPHPGHPGKGGTYGITFGTSGYTEGIYRNRFVMRPCFRYREKTGVHHADNPFLERQRSQGML